MFSVLCVNSFSYVERNDQVGNRGLELMRESNINQKYGDYLKKVEVLK